MKKYINGCLAIILAFVISYLFLGALTWCVCWLFRVESCWRYVVIVPLLWMFIYGSIRRLINRRS